MMAQLLWIAGALIVLVLGTLHLAYTFFTDKFCSRNTNVVEEMKQSFPRLTNKTTLWKAWIGFNASHSVGAIFIGLVNIILAIQYFELLKAILSFTNAEYTHPRFLSLPGETILVQNSIYGDINYIALLYHFDSYYD